ncbi:trypsin-like peptidase domain-containing protein [Cereibacter azotoformans]|uniref:RNA-directed DNA polymerase n=1 Tax=Cereibacter azotoformans TaxID=43057 RepID=A0A2T5JZ32_9RHOB|nr:reverse transcriptase domain-containing protein [Cereibacter azotoformans]MBO4170593.1 trypsin-like peptidase domain-containing protein [Cereibacter azotoformans]PTR15405.1 RNA-directed DNA polymerase [Cereibacter azotoformans]UIJ30121.1 trypsin-like peptidase domain-containing protein [Cereibacter azotoformans]
MPSGSYIFGSGKPRIGIPDELTTLSKMLDYLGISDKELLKIRLSRSFMYSEFTIPSPKKARLISAPDARLKFLQGRLKSSFEKFYRPRLSTHGFVSGRSIITNAAIHARKRHVLSLDLKAFFPSITENRVRGLFRNLGFATDVCDAITTICCHAGYLPQGAPTSPIISNLICFSLDRDLHSFAKKQNLVFTRYADDISISTNGTPAGLFSATVPSPGKLDISALSVDLIDVVVKNGFFLNEEKIRFSSGSHRKIVTGLIVNEFPNVPRTYISNIRAILFSIMKDGYAVAEAKFRQKRPSAKRSLEQYLRGKLNHLANVRGKGDPIYRSLADKFNKEFLPSLATEPTPRERQSSGIWIIEWQYNDRKIDKLYGEAEANGQGIMSVTEGAQGTAFFLDGVGLVSAEHCAPPEEIDLEFFRVFHPSAPNLKFEVKVAKRCKVRDICILKHDVPENKFEGLKPCRVPARGGDVVRAFGFTDYQVGDAVTTSRGEVSHVATRSGVKLLNLSFKIGQGMSGGPIMDRMERVVGVVHKGGPLELRDYAVTLNAVLSLHEEASL